MHIRICWQVVRKTLLLGQFPETRLPFFLSCLHLVKTITIHVLKRQNALLNEKIVKYCSNQRGCTQYARELFYF